MMKNLSFCIFLLFFFSFSNAQLDESGWKSMVNQEAKNYQNLLDYNVNPNTLNYDLRYQRLDLKIDPAQVFLSGSVTSYFVPNQNLSSIYFDLTNLLTVSEVNYHGQNVSFSQLSTKELKIDFSGTLTSGVLDSLKISYSGVPQTTDRGLYFSTVAGAPVAYTLTEPYGPREWFPTKQSLNDKIEKLDLVITSPNEYDVAGNGKLMSVQSVSPTEHQTFWRTHYPIPAYLVAIGVATYAKHEDVISDPPFPFVNYIYPNNNGGSTLVNVEWTKEIMPIYEQYFGAYPYRNEKYGHMDCTAYGGAMEHATMSSMGYWGKDGIAHELVHQWFGDKITCGAWNDIWLNEGFATFGTHLAYEKLLADHAGFLTYLKNELDKATYYTQGSVYVPDADLGNVTRVFDGRLTYAKGGFVLRMLKWILGEDVFYNALREYASRPNLAYSYAKTQDFKASMEQSTSKDLIYFFNEWIYGEGYPSYQLRWNQVGNRFFLKASQTTSASNPSFFHLPLPVKLIGTNGEVLHLKLEHSENNQVFQELVDFHVSSVVFNDEYQIVEKNSNVTYDANLSVSESHLNTYSIFPNPVQDLLYVKGFDPDVDYRIYNMNGDLVLKGNIGKDDIVNVSKLKSGVYMIRIHNMSLKFLKK